MSTYKKTGGRGATGITTQLLSSSRQASASAESQLLGIYVQVPFCQTKCTYCNFHTGPAARSLYRTYALAIQRELEHRNSLYSAAGLPDAAPTSSTTVDTVYIGGGTPSLLDPAELTGILDTIRKHFRCDLREVTLEADPETIHAENAAQWRAAG